MILDGEYYSYKKVNNGGYNSDLQKCIEDTFQYCVECTNMESSEKINKPVMMLGKIQSGKTRAFTGVIALAFDNQFDMIFILTKNSKALVEQTITRMKKEFSFRKHSVIVTDIIKASKKMSGYELEQKNIIVAKKEKNNINKLIEFIEKYSINENKKCLIIDDEADTTGIGYQKNKGCEEYTLRTVSSKVNKMRGTLDGCVFVEVTATPYALYLQPEFDETAPIKPIKPLKTILVPSGEDYIGGDYYFIKSKDESHPASLLFEAMSQEECDLVSDQKRKGKKSKIDDRRSFKIEEILIRDDRLSVFKKGLINFVIGSIVLRKLYNDTEHYAYVIHTAMQKNSHFSLESAAEEFMNQIKNRTEETIPIIDKLLRISYEDIKQSVEKYMFEMPDYEYVKKEFYHYIDKEFYRIDVVNGDNDIESLLDEETGELILRTPCSIFVGGQVLDRGVTIHNMIGFYYGRNPNTMQQDTVLQHSRMFGYRKKILPVTRFYTTERIHSNMEKITEIDEMLRADIAKGKQGEGVYFITREKQDKQFGTGDIKPCSPDKIRASDIILLKSHHRLLPVGFTPASKSVFLSNTKKIEKILDNAGKIDEITYKISLEQGKELVKNVYATFKKDMDAVKFINLSEFETAMRYFSRNDESVLIQVYRNMNLSKYKKDGVKLQDSPDTASTHLKIAKKTAQKLPVLMLFQENGEDVSWGNRPFWWPVLVAPKDVPNAIYASKIVDGEVNS